MNIDSLLNSFLQSQDMDGLPKDKKNKLLLDHYQKGYYQAKKAMESASKDTRYVNLGTGSAPNMLPPLPKSKYAMDISLLKEITVSQMELRRNEGYYFRGKVVGNPWKMPGPSCGVNTILEDKNGEYVRGNFYGVAKTENWSELDKLFPIGREIIILHPFYKIAMDGFPSVRIENKYEFYFVDEISNRQGDFEELLEKSQAMKDEANKELKININRALDKYLKSVDVLLKERPKFTLDKDEFVLAWKINMKDHEKKQAMKHLAIVFSNCSLAYIENKQPLSALFYARFSNWCNPNFFKANLRIARALIDLLHLSEAETLLNNLIELKEAAQFVKEIKSLLEETINLAKEYSSPNTAVKFLKNELEWSEEKAYIGPIELFDSKEKGRGFQAKRDIPRGEILLIEKGFVYPQHNPEFTYQLLEKLNKKEDLKALYMNLFPTPRYPASQYLSTNLSEKLSESFARSIFSVHRAANPKQWESFTENEVNQLLYKTQLNTFAVNKETGIFPHYCLFNHSCDPNVTAWHKGEMVMVLAQRGIKKGEEICVSYAPGAENNIERGLCLIHYGFECKCARCMGSQEWKEKESKLTGLRCTECAVDIAVGDDKTFVCPKCHIKREYSEYKNRDKKIREKLAEITKDQIQLDHKKLEELLQVTEKELSKNSLLRAAILNFLAQSYAQLGKEEKFQQCFNEIVKMARFCPLIELYVIISHLMEIIVKGFKRNLRQEELEVLSAYGLTQEIVNPLWADFEEKHNEIWFLPKIEFPEPKK